MDHNRIEQSIAIRNANKSRLLEAVYNTEADIWDRARNMEAYQHQTAHFINALDLFVQHYKNSFVQNNIIPNQHDQLGQDPEMMPPQCNLNPSQNVLRTDEPYTMRQQNPQFLSQQGMGDQHLTVPGGPSQENRMAFRPNLSQKVLHQQQMLRQMGELKQKLLVLGASEDNVAMLPQVINEMQQIQKQLDQTNAAFYTSQFDQVHWTPDDIRQKQQYLRQTYDQRIREVIENLNSLSTEVCRFLVDKTSKNLIFNGIIDAKIAVFKRQQLLHERPDYQTDYQQLRIKLFSFEDDIPSVFRLAQMAEVQARHYLNAVIQSPGPSQQQPQGPQQQEGPEVNQTGT